MDKQEWVQWFINQYGISEEEAEDCYRVTVDMANFCINEYLKYIQTGKSVLSPFMLEWESLHEFLKRSKEKGA